MTPNSYLGWQAFVTPPAEEAFYATKDAVASEGSMQHQQLRQIQQQWMQQQQLLQHQQHLTQQQSQLMQQQPPQLLQQQSQLPLFQSSPSLGGLPGLGSLSSFGKNLCSSNTPFGAEDIVPSLSLDDLALLEISLDDALASGPELGRSCREEPGSDSESSYGGSSYGCSSDGGILSPAVGSSETATGVSANRFIFPTTLDVPATQLSPKTPRRVQGAATAPGGDEESVTGPQVQMRYKRSVEMRARRRQADAIAGRFNCLVPGCGKHYNSSGGIRYHLRNCEHPGLQHSPESRRQLEAALEKDEASRQRRHLLKLRGLDGKKRRPRSMIVIETDASAGHALAERDQEVPGSRRLQPQRQHTEILLQQRSAPQSSPLAPQFTDKHRAMLMRREQSLATTSALYDEFNGSSNSFGDQNVLN